MADKVAFTRPAAERIGRVVRVVESGNRAGSPYVVNPLLSDGVRDGIKFCSWSATWPYNQTATITFASSTSNTATATNVILGVGAGDGWVARKGSAGWSLIGFDMTKQPGYAAGEIQLFGHSSSSAVAEWYSITTCATATA